MAINQEQSDFNDAFGEDTPVAPVQTEDEAFGLNLPGADAPAADKAPTAADGAAPTEGSGDSPAVVAVIAGAGDGKSENDPAAQANADAANAAANEGASASERGSSPAVAETGGAAAEGSAAEEASETPAAEAAEQAAGAGDPYDLSDVPPEDMQKAKSWVGRLKKLEGDLKARAAAGGDKSATAEVTQTADALETVALQSDASDPAMAAEVDDAAAKVASGEMTPEEAMAQLAEDFGPSFVKAIELVVRSMTGKEVGEKLGKVSQDTQDIIDHLTNQAERAHFQQIQDAHPDFVQIQEDPRFKAWVAENGKEDVAATGSAKAINQMLSEFKAATAVTAPDDAPAGDTAAAATPAAPAAAAPAEAAPAVAQVDQGAMDDAEGIRSNGGGLRLPEEPRKGGDFESAWNDF